MRRQGLPLLLEAFLVIEWVILAPAFGVSFVFLVVGVIARGGPPSGTLPLAVLGVGALAALNVLCWQLRPWALWLRAALCFAVACALAPVAAEHPEIWVLVVERMLQTGLAVWLAARS